MVPDNFDQFEHLVQRPPEGVRQLKVILPGYHAGSHDDLLDVQQRIDSSPRERRFQADVVDVEEIVPIEVERVVQIGRAGTAGVGIRQV